MYLSERYLEMLQNVDVEEPKSQQQKNGKNYHCIITLWLFIVSALLIVVFSKTRKS